MRRHGEVVLRPETESKLASLALSSGQAEQWDELLKKDFTHYYLGVQRSRDERAEYMRKKFLPWPAAGKIS